MRKLIIALCLGLAAVLGQAQAQTSIQQPTLPVVGASVVGATPSMPLWITSAGVLATTPNFTFGTVTANAPFQVSQTWNNGGVIFRAMEVLATNTAAATGSRAFRVVVNGQVPFEVDGGTAGASVIFGQSSFGSTNNFNFSLWSGAKLGFISATSIGPTTDPDTYLTRVAATTLGVTSRLAAIGSAPALTSCGGGSPAIIGSDLAGTVTMGTTATGCVITFNVAYVAAPHCVVSWQANLASMQYTVSTTAITLVQTSTSGNKVNYHCIAQSGG